MPSMQIYEKKNFFFEPINYVLLQENFQEIDYNILCCIIMDKAKTCYMIDMNKLKN